MEREKLQQVAENVECSTEKNKSLGIDLPADSERRIYINIGGTQFVTLLTTLHRFPNTRLPKLVLNKVDAELEKNEFFFDRNPVFFNYILDYYRTGKSFLLFMVIFYVHI